MHGTLTHVQVKMAMERACRIYETNVNTYHKRLKRRPRNQFTALIQGAACYFLLTDSKWDSASIGQAFRRTTNSVNRAIEGHVCRFGLSDPMQGTSLVK